VKNHFFITLIIGVLLVFRNGVFHKLDHFRIENISRCMGIMIIVLEKMIALYGHVPTLHHIIIYMYCLVRKRPNALIF